MARMRSASAELQSVTESVVSEAARQNIKLVSEVQNAKGSFEKMREVALKSTSSAAAKEAGIELERDRLRNIAINAQVFFYDDSQCHTVKADKERLSLKVASMIDQNRKLQQV